MIYGTNNNLQGGIIKVTDTVKALEECREKEEGIRKDSY